ncbi:MAG: flavin reductase family protein [Pseudomonadota bacterium]
MNQCSMTPELGRALGRLVYGLYFLTTATPAEPQGLLVSWVSQVSGEPPLLLAAVRENRSILPALIERRAFCLNLLPEANRELIGQLARPAGRRFAGVDLNSGPLGLPLIAAGLGGIACTLLEASQPGDHVLCLGRVEEAVALAAGVNQGAAATGHPYLGLS